MAHLLKNRRLPPENPFYHAARICGRTPIPGVVLLALSILAVVVSILALLLLTVPAYRLFSAILLRTPVSPGVNQQPDFVSVNPNRRHVDVKIVE